jgi:hypothetical protein
LGICILADEITLIENMPWSTGHDFGSGKLRDPA